MSPSYRLLLGIVIFLCGGYLGGQFVFWVFPCEVDVIGIAITSTMATFFIGLFGFGHV